MQMELGMSSDLMELYLKIRIKDGSYVKLECCITYYCCRGILQFEEKYLEDWNGHWSHLFRLSDRGNLTPYTG